MNPAQKFKMRMQQTRQVAESAAVAKSADAAEFAAAAIENAIVSAVGNSAYAFQKRIKQKAARKRLEILRNAQKQQRLEEIQEEQEGFQLQLHQLDQDEKRLRELPRGVARHEMIRSELLPNWRPVVEEYISSKDNYPNQALILVMIWAFNVADMELAMRLAMVAIGQDQQMPDRFKRDVRTFVADEVYNWAEAQALKKQSCSPWFDQVFELVDGWLIPDALKLKYWKLAARIVEDKQPAAALELYQKAFDLDPVQAKCKTRIEKLTRKVAKIAEAASRK